MDVAGQLKFPLIFVPVVIIAAKKKKTHTHTHGAPTEGGWLETPVKRSTDSETVASNTLKKKQCKEDGQVISFCVSFCGTYSRPWANRLVTSFVQ